MTTGTHIQNELLAVLNKMIRESAPEEPEGPEAETLSLIEPASVSIVLAFLRFAQELVGDALDEAWEEWPEYTLGQSDPRFRSLVEASRSLRVAINTIGSP